MKHYIERAFGFAGLLLGFAGLALGGCDSKAPFHGLMPDAGPSEGESESEPGPVIPDLGMVRPPPGYAVPLTPTPDNSQGLRSDDAGHLVLDPAAPSAIFPYIWISDSVEGKVSKLRTDTGVEVGRYWAGPAGGSTDPSRTTVGLNGDVYVGNRTSGTVSRIHADTTTCPDKNGDGVITTSTGAGDVKDWGADECVLWNTPIPSGYVRAMAADYSIGTDGELSAGVWVGNWNDQTMYKLDTATGMIVAMVPIGRSPYGAAFDGSGNLWVQGSGFGLVRVDTVALTKAEEIPYDGDCGAYGLTVDSVGRVWIAGGNCVGRYDPATRTWSKVHVGSSGRGIAVDDAGSAWSADTSFGAHRIDTESLAVLADIPMSGGFVGMAVDVAGQIWAVNQGNSAAHRINPATLAVDIFPVGQNPYTYSDMTGFQLQNAAPPTGQFTSIAMGCNGPQEWTTLAWSATTPPGTQVLFRGRVADTTAQLGNKPWAQIAEASDQPGASVSPADLVAPLTLADGTNMGAILQLEVTLRSATRDSTPTVSGIRLFSVCGSTLN